MQYDVQRSDPKKPGDEKLNAARAPEGALRPRGFTARLGRKRKEPTVEVSARADARTASAPLLRERMREVLERDRAMAEAQCVVTPRALAQRAVAPQGLAAAPAAELAAPVAAPAPEPVSKLEEPVEAKSGTHVRLPPEDDELSSLFASWIEEELELGEVTAVSEQPMAFANEPAPAEVPAQRASSVPPPLPKSSARAQLPRAEPAADALAEPTARAEDDSEVVVLSVFKAPRTGTQRTGAAQLAVAAAHSDPAREPIRTRTMARLLATHGYYTRALSIYDHLIAREPANAELRAEAELLRTK